MGTVKIANRFSGAEKPTLAKVLANFDNLLNFVNQIPDSANVGTFDQENWTDSINQKLGVNSAGGSLRRKWVQLTNNSAANVSNLQVGGSPNVGWSTTINVPDTSSIVKISLWGNIIPWFSGTFDPIGNTLYGQLTIDGVATDNSASATGKLFASSSALGRDVYSGCAQTFTDPDRTSSASFQTRALHAPLCIPSLSVGNHTVGIGFSTFGATAGDYLAKFNFLRAYVEVESFS